MQYVFIHNLIELAAVLIIREMIGMDGESYVTLYLPFQKLH